MKTNDVLSKREAAAAIVLVTAVAVGVAVTFAALLGREVLTKNTKRR